MNLHIKVITICFLLTLSSKFLFSQSKPDIRCLAVAPNGDVTITWMQYVPAPGNAFDQYQIWYSTDNVNFTLLPDFIPNIATTSFTHTGANAHLGIRYYMLIVEYTSGANPLYTPASDTLQTMFLTVNNNLPVADGFASIDWNPIKTPKLASTSNSYDIHRRKAFNGVWANVGNTFFGTETYADTKKVCNDTLYFTVEQTDVSGCKSVSSLAKKLIFDKRAPGTPLIDSISVNPASNEVFLKWTPDGSGDIRGYVIVRDQVIIATVIGKNSISFIDPNGNPNTHSVKYGVAAIDTCANGNPLSYNTSSTGILHSTIFVKAVPNNCEKKIDLTWTPYVGWNAVQDYYIEAQENGGPWKRVGTVDGNVNEYTHQNVKPGTQYCYTIRAKQVGFSTTSSSNQVCLKTSSIELPKDIYITCLHVEDSDQVVIKFYVPKKSEATGYLIKKSIHPDSLFEPVDTILPTKTDTLYKFKDRNVQADTNIYYYMISALDSCKNEYYFSDTSNTVRITGEKNDLEFYTSLKWNGYGGFEHAGSRVNQYVLYRSLNNNQNFVELDSFVNTTSKFKDEVEKLLENNGKFCYYINAQESKTNNVYGFKESCNSNKVCLGLEEIVWVPTAFTPDFDDINDVFKPIISFVDKREYEFTIYDRWGTSIYSTTNPLDGWDGGGYNAPIGYYSYFLQFKNSAGDVLQRRGSFLLIR